MQKFFLSFIALATVCGELRAASPAFSGNHPWLTGPLITPSGRIVKKGHFLLEPYLYHTWVTGRYGDNWETISIPIVRQFNPQLVVRIGMTEKMNFSCIIQGVLNTVNQRTSVGVGDLPFGFDYQLFNDGIHSAKFTIQEIFPTGKFQKLEPAKFGTDTAGQGAFVTQFGLTFAKLVHFSGQHYLNTRINFTGLLPAPTRVKAINAYGGDPTTRGKIFPGCGLNIFLGAEYTLTENWALAIDIGGQFNASSRFKGVTEVPVGFPPGANINLAPAIEYNWNESIGLIVGSWFTIAGRNSSQFASAVAALNIFY